jgi:hypothetical protein
MVGEIYVQYFQEWTWQGNGYAYGRYFKGWLRLGDSISENVQCQYVQCLVEERIPDDGSGKRMVMHMAGMSW